MTQTLNSEQDDLLISPYLDEAKLPTILRDLLPMAKTPAQKDILLLSVLTAAGSAMPNTYFTYGLARHTYYPNLICFIEAMAAQGKSIASIGQQLLAPIDAESPLFLAADSTHAAFVHNLAEQMGVGFCYESEGSVITDIWHRSGCNGYNSLLRKAAEHEEYRLSRRSEQGDLIIPCPRLSMLITGTFDQFSMLVPSATNGLFSRILPLVIRQNATYDPSLALTILPEDDIAPSPLASSPLAPSPISFYAQRLRQLNHALRDAEQSIRFCLTAEQAATIGQAFYADSQALMPRLGQNFHQSIARMTVHTLRIAHILSLLHWIDIPTNPTSSTSLTKGLLFCSASDFTMALLIGRKLLLHAADAYTQINADRTLAIPAVRGSYQQLTFLSALPAEFSTEDCMAIAEQSGVARRSVERWLSAWSKDGVLQKLAVGFYRKTA